MLSFVVAVVGLAGTLCALGKPVCLFDNVCSLNDLFFITLVLLLLLLLPVEFICFLIAKLAVCEVVSIAPALGNEEEEKCALRSVGLKVELWSTYEDNDKGDYYDYE